MYRALVIKLIINKHIITQTILIVDKTVGISIPKFEFPNSVKTNEYLIGLFIFPL